MQEANAYSPKMSGISYNADMRTQADVRQFILAESQKAGLGKGALKHWSEAIGRNHAYLQQFVKRGVPDRLQELDRKKLALVMGVEETLLMDDAHARSATTNGNHTSASTLMRQAAPLHVVPAESLMGQNDLPVFSTVQGGTGVPVMSSEPFQHIARPQNLIGIKGAYGVLVRGESMAREFNEGDIAYVDPHKPPKKDDPCVFQGETATGEMMACIKYLERSPEASDTVFYVSQTNPPRKFTLKKSDYQICHVAVGKIAGR